jgi:hypothetical protein
MKRNGLLKHQLQLTKRGDSDKYEIVPISDYLSFEKGLFIFIRACQLLSHHIEGVIMVGLAGPSGAGKTMFCDKLVGFMPGIITISMDNYNDASRVIDGNYDGKLSVSLSLSTFISLSEWHMLTQHFCSIFCEHFVYQYFPYRTPFSGSLDFGKKKKFIGMMSLQ